MVRIFLDKTQMKNIKVKTKFDGIDRRHLVKTDRKRLQQVLLNLLANAVKFTERNGNIFIQVKASSATCLQISVTDSGEGIAANERERLYKLFGNQKPNHNVEGIGLGLVISKKIVKCFDGCIDFISEGEGTTFFYTFKTEDISEIDRNNYISENENSVFNDQVKIKKVRKKKDSSSSTCSKKIMIVDDEEFCLTSVKVLLKKSGINTDEVDFCITGQEALTKVKEKYDQGGTYKLILTDFMMPIMNGIESTKLIRQFLDEKKIPIED
jgi:CheY-like chemotaxis protein